MALRDLLPEDPRSLGPYRLTGRLGAGGMGVVYLGFDSAGQAVAVKTLRADADVDARIRMRREAEHMAVVSSPRVARLLASDTDADVPWLALAHISGESLAEAETPLGNSALRELAAGLGQALHTLHLAGITHRDVKPGNVILRHDGPVLVDLGIARSDGVTALTQVGSAIGSPGWMPPEQLRGEVVGSAADVWGWGAVMLYAATGRAPFGEGPLEAVGWRILGTDPDLSGVPAWLLPAVRAALSKDPASRPAAYDLQEPPESTATPPVRVVHGSTALDSFPALHTSGPQPSAPPQGPGERSVPTPPTPAQGLPVPPAQHGPPPPGRVLHGSSQHGSGPQSWSPATPPPPGWGHPFAPPPRRRSSAVPWVVAAVLVLALLVILVLAAAMSRLSATSRPVSTVSPRSMATGTVPPRFSPSPNAFSTPDYTSWPAYGRGIRVGPAPGFPSSVLGHRFYSNEVGDVQSFRGSGWQEGERTTRVPPGDCGDYMVLTQWSSLSGRQLRPGFMRPGAASPEFVGPDGARGWAYTDGCEVLSFRDAQNQHVFGDTVMFDVSVDTQVWDRAS